MKLPNLHESVILIDTEFLIKTIKDCYSFYSELYPQKEFKKINLSDILTSIINSSKLPTNNQIISVVFLYKLGNDIIPYLDGPNSISLFNAFPSKRYYFNIKDENLKLELFSYFASLEAFDYEIEYYRDLEVLLEGVAYNDTTFNVCVVADNEYLNTTLDLINERLDKSFLIFRGTNYKIAIDPSGSETLKFHYVNFDYVIGLCMGLKLSEL